MHTSSIIRSLRVNNDASLKVSLLLNRIRSGSSTVLRSPVGAREDPYSILAKWDRIYKSRIESISNQLDDLEMSNRSKFGPRSVAIPWLDRSDMVHAYFKPQESSFVPKAISDLPSGLRFRLRPLSVIAASKFLKSNTSTGLPFYGRKSDFIKLVTVDLKDLLSRKDPCLLFTRTQESRKTRAVWGYPIADTLNEMRFYRPLLSVQKKMPWRSALLGPSQVNSRISKLLTVAKRRKLSVVSIDFSLYDTTVHYKLQNASFNYIKSLFQKEFHSELDYIFERFNSIGLITPDGILSGPHGVPSGSTFTNEIDSICQYLIAKDFGIDDEFMDIQGDDGIYITDRPYDLLEHFGKYGLKVNLEKSLIDSANSVYLQNLHSTDYPDSNGLYSGIYPTYRALGHILFPERYTDYVSFGVRGADFNSIRTISILENCRYHPLFEEFVKFIFELDKYSLAFTRSGLQKYLRRLSEDQVPGEAYLFKLGDNLKGIYNFDTLKVLSKL